MEWIILSGNQLESDQAVRDEIITDQGTLSPSLRIRNNSEEYSASMLTLNDEEAIQRLQSHEAKMSVLKLHGIPVQASSKGRCLRLYIALVFQTEVLVMYQSRNDSIWLAGGGTPKNVALRKVSAKENNREVRKAGALAIRALYALGLDYGTVKLGLQPGKRMIILDVNPSPRLNPEMEKEFCHSIRQYVQQLPDMAPSLEKVVLGADPEFIMRHANGQVVLASKYFPRHGRVGCDAIWYGQDRTAKPLVELRPQPSTEPRQLVIRMYQGMIQAAKRVNDGTIHWLAGALPQPGYPLGGHIHFSGVKLNFKLLRALDNYLALPLVLTEDPRGIRRRPRYGFLGDFRFQYHGGFEYRTLPSWLISPTLTKGVLAAAKLIAVRYPYLRYDPLKQVSMQRAYYHGEKGEIRRVVDDLWDDLSEQKDYEVYRTYLDRFYNYLISGTTWDEKKDFRVLWKLPPFHR